MEILKLEKEYFNFKISRDNQDLSTALLEINESLIFCNLINYSIFVSVSQIKNKLLLLECHLNPKASHFVTNIVLRHD